MDKLTCDLTWVESHLFVKLNFYVLPSCFLAAHSASVSSHQLLNMWIQGWDACSSCVFAFCSSKHSLSLQKYGPVSALSRNRSVLCTRLDLDLNSASHNDFTQQSLFIEMPPCWDSHMHIHIHRRPKKLSILFGRRQRLKVAQLLLCSCQCCASITKACSTAMKKNKMGNYIFGVHNSELWTDFNFWKINCFTVIFFTFL